jgi:hypothetical protein
LFVIVCSSCIGITINCIGSCSACILGVGACGCFCFVLPIQYKLQPTMKVRAITGAKRSMDSLLRFFLLGRFVISSPATFLLLNS